MNINTKSYLFNEITVKYLLDEETRQIAMVLLPNDEKTYYEERREWLKIPELIKTGMDQKAWQVGNLCHLALRHHNQGNGAGNTLKHGQSTKFLKFHAQSFTEENGKSQIVTHLKAEEGYEVIHTLSHYENEKGFEVETEFFNHTGRRVTLDLLTSFSLDNISPYQKADAPHALALHRYRGGWSLEGKHCVDDIEDLNLERSWLCAFPEGERYGCIGSHPVKRFFPFGAVEDKENQTFWGAQLASNSSWQMELSREDDCYSLSGGIADCEFGGWWKEIKPGESFKAPKAFISTAKGTIDDLCYNLTDMHHKYVDEQPQSEHTLPILFNDWCTTWGNPTHEKMIAIAKRMEGSPVKYITIDAGWTDVLENSFGQGGNGDWEYSHKKFPQGIIATSREVKKLGFKLGIWFEFEVTTKGAKVFEKAYDDMHLKRNNELIITGGDRSFWDFRNSETIAYLKNKVIDFLKENEIDYLKVDYNGSIGIGCDGAESLGEGLRQQMQAVKEFFMMIREEMPNLIIENCASGGHRLEPCMMDITAMSSFSDAHECDEIPYIAASLHNLILPRQSQIWAVINPEYTKNTLYYRLSSVFLGRFCLSGNTEALDEEQWQIIKEAMAFYEACKNVIKYGKTVIYGNRSNNTRHPAGTQAVLRLGKDQETGLLVCHGFKETMKQSIEITLPDGNWEIEKIFGEKHPVKIAQNVLVIDPVQDFTGFACILKK